MSADRRLPRAPVQAKGTGAAKGYGRALVPVGGNDRAAVMIGEAAISLSRGTHRLAMLAAHRQVRFPGIEGERSTPRQPHRETHGVWPRGVGWLVSITGVRKGLRRRVREPAAATDAVAAHPLSPAQPHASTPGVISSKSAPRKRELQPSAGMDTEPFTPYRIPKELGCRRYLGNTDSKERGMVHRYRMFDPVKAATLSLAMAAVASSFQKGIAQDSFAGQSRDSAGIRIVENVRPADDSRLPWRVGQKPSVSIGAVVGEFVGSSAGLGHLIRLANSELATDLMFAALLALGCMGTGLFLLVAGLEKTALRRWGGAVETIGR